MKNAMRSATPHYTWIQGCYWMVYCILLSFSSVYLLEQGLSNTEIGLLLGLSGLASALLQPVAGARAGRMRRLSLGQLSGCLVGGMGLCALGLLLLPGKWVQGGLFMVLLALLQMLAPFLYAIGMGCAAQNIPLNFGLARGVGAGAYALASSLCGGLTALWGVGSIPLVLLAASLLLLVATLTFRPGTVPAPRPAAPAPTTSGEEPAFLRKYPHLLPLLVGATLLYTSQRHHALPLPDHPGGGAAAWKWASCSRCRADGHPRHGGVFPTAAAGRVPTGCGRPASLFPSRAADLGGPLPAGSLCGAGV
ncbi:MAG: MFS transporter [Evtepia sp.]